MGGVDSHNHHVGRFKMKIPPRRVLRLRVYFFPLPATLHGLVLLAMTKTTYSIVKQVESSHSDLPMMEESRPNLSVDDLKRQATIFPYEECPITRLPESRRCRPLFLRRATLLAFLVLFLLQILALVILYSYSLRHDVIVPVAAKYHQAWKYGPSASTSAASSMLCAVLERLVLTANHA